MVRLRRSGGECGEWKRSEECGVVNVGSLYGGEKRKVVVVVVVMGRDMGFGLGGFVMEE